MVYAILSFYRAMMCIARTVPSQDVCLFVCHTPVSAETAKCVLKHFSPSCSHTILVCTYHTVW